MQASIVHYDLGSHPVTGAGRGASDAELNEALLGPVAAIVFDDAGTSQLSGLLEGLGDTDFTRANLATLLGGTPAPEDWRVGEAIAESYLAAFRDCEFPWPDGRDERRRGSSLPGADLVGFQTEDDRVRFAFGEVKTSSEAKHPPGAVYGRHGLKQQLEDLRDRKDIRDSLVRYLAHRAASSSWEARFRSATILYLQDSCNVRVFGVLIRDVTPHPDDLRVRVEDIGRSCPAVMKFELIALYLPKGRIQTLANTVVSARTEGGTS